MPIAPAGEPLLTIGEAAVLLGVTPQTIRNWTTAGKLAAVVTPGGHRRYRREDVEAALRPAPVSNGEAGAA